MDYIQFSAKTKSEAITKACIDLGVSSDQLEIQVVSEGSSGFFGFGSKPAIIKVKKKIEKVEEIVEPVQCEVKEEKKADLETKIEKVEETKPVKAESEKKHKSDKPYKAKDKHYKDKPSKERQPKDKANKEKPSKEKPVKEKPVKPVEIITDAAEIKEIEVRAEEFLRKVFNSMKLGEVEITSKYNTEDGSLEVNFEGEDVGVLIGKRGQTLDSLQYLTSLVVNKGKSSYVRVKLDTEDYRRRRKETLENLAKGVASKVKKTRKAVILEPMNPYERRIIHSALQNDRYVSTHSEGEEPYRRVVVTLNRK